MDLVGATDLLDVGILQLWMTTRSDHYMPNDEVSGCVKLICSKSLSIRGLWVKFTGVNILKNLNERRIKTHEGVDLLVGDADHYLGGMHDVLVGFGEQDEIELASDASTPLLPLASGDHTWNFSFQIPSEAPFSYCDIYTEIAYSATIYMDIPKVSRIASQISYPIKVGCTGIQHIPEAGANGCCLWETHQIPLTSSILGNGHTDIVSVKVRPLLKRFLRASLGRTDDDTRMMLTMAPGSIPSSAIFDFQSIRTILNVRCTVVTDQTATPLKFLARLLVCINLRNNVTVPFQSIRKLLESGDMVGQTPVGKKEALEHAGACHVIWTSSVDVESPRKSNHVDFDVPISIDPEVRASCLAERPIVRPLPHDQTDSILSFSTSEPLFEYKVVLEVSVYQGDQVSPLLPACIGEILVRPPAPSRSVRASSASNSVVRSPQCGGVLASSGACEDPNRVCSVLPGITAGSQLTAASRFDGNLVSLRKDGGNPLPDKDMSVRERKGESDSDSAQHRNSVGGSSGPVTPHARKLIPHVMGEAVSRGPAAVLCDRTNHPHRQVQIPSSRFAAAFEGRDRIVGSGATVVCDASAATSLGCCGATGFSNDSPIIAYLSGMNVSHTHVDDDCSHPLYVLRTPQRIGSREGSDNPGHAQRLSFSLQQLPGMNSCPDEVQDCESLDFNHSNRSPPLIMMSRPHPASVSLSRPLVLRY